MAEGRLPNIALKWMSKQKRAQGRPKKNWMKDIRKATNERILEEDQWEDRKQWSLGVGQRRKTFLNRYIHISRECFDKLRLLQSARNFVFPNPHWVHFVLQRFSY